MPATGATSQPDTTALPACGRYNTIVVCKDGTRLTSMLITPNLCDGHGGIVGKERIPCK
jgi:hypothetical protein